MSSYIAQALSLAHPPLAIYYAQSDLGAKSFKSKKNNPGGWGCVMFLVAAAAKGAKVSFCQDTCLCPGAARGMGLGTPDDGFPGGPESFRRFLSSGNKHWETGRQIAQKMREAGADPETVEEFLEGEGFKKNPELVASYLENVPPLEPEGPFVIIEPLTEIHQDKPAKAVIFLADAEQLSALTVLANYARAGLDNVRLPFGSGCQSLGFYPLWEAAQKEPKAVVGLTDISARLYLKKILGRDLLSFTAPWSLYREMEDNAPESFLKRLAWNKLHNN